MDTPKAPEDVDRRLLLILGAFAAVLLLQSLAGYVRTRHLYEPGGVTLRPAPRIEEHLLEGVLLAAPYIGALAASVRIRYALVLSLLAMAVHQAIATTRGNLEWPSEEMIRIGAAVALIAIVARRVHARPRAMQILVLILSLAVLHFLWFVVLLIFHTGRPIRWKFCTDIALFESLWRTLPCIPLVTAWCFLRRSNPPPDSATGPVP